jgi:hypothetical protein
MKTVLFFAAAIALACGGASGPCPQRSGAGTVKFTARSGTCGPIGEAVVKGQEGSTPTPPCTGTITHSADNCEMTVDSTCPNGSGSLRQVGSGTFNQAGTSGTAVFSFTLKDATGSVSCTALPASSVQR